MKDIGNTRDVYIDFLRGLGLLLLLIAHTSPPDWLFIFRTFDVPLMVFVSSYCYKPLRSNTIDQSGRGYLKYSEARFKRIYIPVFIFLTIYFLLFKIYTYVTEAVMFSLPTVIGSYLLFNIPSIGYVWIMRVFLIMALFIPFFYSRFAKLKCIAFLFLITFLIAIQFFLIQLAGLIKIEILNFIYSEYVLYLIGYLPIVLLGININNYSKKEIFIIIITLITELFITFSIFGIRQPQTYKYPPSLIYILYGLIASSCLWIFKPLLFNLSKLSFWVYLSKNSMWLYLWHILAVNIFVANIKIPNYLLRYGLVLISTITFFCIYRYIVKLLFPGKSIKIFT